MPQRGKLRLVSSTNRAAGDPSMAEHLSPQNDPGERSLDDDQLMCLVSANDRRAFASLVQRHRNVLLRVCSLMLHDENLAEELSQEVFVRLWHNRVRYRPQGKLRQYLLTIARNLCRSELRKRSVRSLFGLQHDPIAPQPSSEEMLEREQRAALIQAAIHNLPDSLQIPLLLRYRDELSYEEISAATGLKGVTARSRVHSGLKALAKLLPLEVLT